MTAYQVLLNAGEVTVPAATASLLVNVSPIFTALLAVTLLGGEPILRGLGAGGPAAVLQPGARAVHRGAGSARGRGRLGHGADARPGRGARARR